MVRMLRALWGAWMQIMGKDSETQGRSKDLSLTIVGRGKKVVENSLARQKHQK